jgi:hypothetical protein
MPGYAEVAVKTLTLLADNWPMWTIRRCRIWFPKAINFLKYFYAEALMLPRFF